MITVKEVTSKKELKSFIQFSFKLFQDNPYWIPPLITEELETFDPKKNPALEHADAKYFMAYKGKEPVGKVAAIINWREVDQLGRKTVRFGWFDVIDDLEVTKALLAKVSEFGWKNQLEYIEGPMGFNNLDKVGVLTEGFDEKGTAISWYSPQYYHEHFEALGFYKEKEWQETRFPFSNIDPKQFKRGADMVRKRYNLTPLQLTSTKAVMPYVDEMFGLFNRTYSRLPSFVGVSDTQIAYFKKKYMGLINPAYIKFILDENDTMIAFSVIMPDFADALQKANGKLFPFGFLHLLRAKKHNKTVAFYLIGIEEKYQNKGVTAILLDECYKSCKKEGVETCISTPELVENHAVHNLWKTFGPTIHKRRRTYRKPIPVTNLSMRVV